MSKDLISIRNAISSLDEAILSLLSERMRLAGEIAIYKKEHNLPIFDPKRESEILEAYAKLVDFDIRNIFQAIMEESKKIQNKIISE